MRKEYEGHINDLYRNVQLFSTLTSGELDEVRGKIAVKKFQKNEVICTSRVQIR